MSILSLSVLSKKRFVNDRFMKQLHTHFVHLSGNFFSLAVFECADFSRAHFYFRCVLVAQCVNSRLRLCVCAAKRAHASHFKVIVQRWSNKLFFFVWVMQLTTSWIYTEKSDRLCARVFMACWKKSNKTHEILAFVKREFSVCVCVDYLPKRWNNNWN